MSYWAGTGAARPSLAVTTIANLRTMGPASQFVDGMQARVTGINSFEWSSTSSAADDGSTVVKPSAVVGSGRWLVQSFASSSLAVRSFGTDLVARARLNMLDGIFATDDSVGAQTALSIFEPARVTCHARATANFNLASPPNHTFDGYTLAKYDVVWLPSQTTSSENGFYIYTGAAGAAGFAKLTSLDALITATGVNVFVIKGSTYASTFFRWKTGDAPVALRDGAPLQATVRLESFYVVADGDDFSPAMRRANDAVSDCGDILLGRTRYRFQTTVNVTRAWNLIGAGFSSTVLAGDQTVFNFVATNTDDNPMLAAPGGNRLENLWIKCNSHLSTDAVDMHGIFSNRAIYMDRVFISGWPGNGVHIAAYAITGDPNRGGAKGNANCCAFYNCIANDIGRNGYYFEGTDANAGSIIQCQAQHCGKRNIANNEVYTASVDLTTLTLPGDVSGKTLLLTPNGGSLQTVTFTAASTTPANLLSELQAQISGPLSAAIVANHLVLTVTPPVGGPFALLVIGAGTANATLGFAAGTFDADTFAWGFFDNSFLGNTYVACQTTTNVSVFGGAYRAGSNVQQAVLIGCYAESENCYIEFPTFTLAGNLGFQQCPRAGGVIPGIQTTGGGGAIRHTDSVFVANGTNGVQARLAQVGTDQAIKLNRAGDVTGIALQYGTFSNEWSWCRANSANMVPFSMSGPGHARGAGHAIFHRGIHFANGFRRMIMTDDAHLPATNGVAASEGSDFYTVSDVIINSALAAGKPFMWWASAAPSGGAMAWTPVDYVPYPKVSKTINFGTVAAQSEATDTITVNGAAVGDTVIIIEPATSYPGVLFSGRVTSANTVTVRAVNVTAAGVPVSDTFTAVVRKAA